MRGLPVWTDRKVEDLIGNLLRTGVLLVGVRGLLRRRGLSCPARERARRLPGLSRRTERSTHDSWSIARGAFVPGQRHYSIGVAAADCNTRCPGGVVDPGFRCGAGPNVCGICGNRPGNSALQSFWVALTASGIQGNSERKKCRRSNRLIGSSNTLVSPTANENCLPQSGAGQVVLTFSLLVSRLTSRSTTTQVPHLGQVTHELTMRSVMPLQCKRFRDRENPDGTINRLAAYHDASPRGSGAEYPARLPHRGQTR